MKRILTALILIPIVAWVVLWANSWIFLAVLMSVACLCWHEYNEIAGGLRVRQAGDRGLRYWARNPGVVRIFTGSAIVGLVAGGADRGYARPGPYHALPRAALLLLGVVYISAAGNAHVRCAS